MDGPTHFEGGDGQVYVRDGWDRQGALETAGWNFYRISYFDWTEGQETEEKALIEYVQSYFEDRNTFSKTVVLKELEEETAAPEEAPKDIYETDFSDEHVDNVSPVRVASTSSRAKTTRTAKTTPPKPTFSIGDRVVDQESFERYLMSHQRKKSR